MERTRTESIVVLHHGSSVDELEGGGVKPGDLSELVAQNGERRVGICWEVDVEAFLSPFDGQRHMFPASSASDGDDDGGEKDEEC